MKQVFKTIQSLNNSKFLAGLAMIILNLGSKYLIMELSESQEELMSNKIFRRIILFTVAFIATRDIIVSLVLTGVFVILVSNLFNENSKMSLLKKNKNTFNKVSKLDYMKALKIKDLYELQQKKKD